MATRSKSVSSILARVSHWSGSLDGASPLSLSWGHGGGLGFCTSAQSGVGERRAKESVRLEKGFRTQVNSRQHSGEQVGRQTLVGVQPLLCSRVTSLPRPLPPNQRAEKHQALVKAPEMTTSFPICWD